MITQVQRCEQNASALGPGSRSSSSSSTGQFVRLWGLDTFDLPPAVTPHTDLAPFLTVVFHEAVGLIDHVPITAAAVSSGLSAWRPNGTKRFSRSAAPVQLFKRVIPAEHLRAVAQDHHRHGLKRIRPGSVRTETWNLRRSVHEDAAMPGTACWEEWRRRFTEDQAGAEMGLTRTVLSTRRMKSWKCRDLKIVQGDHTWTNITMRWEESVHRLPFPLKKRVFPVVHITASDENHAYGAEILVVQIAVRDDDAAARYGAVLGAYTSVERLRGTAEGVEWIMAAVSDAGGVVPDLVQRLVLPGRIAKDVDLFLRCIADERRRKFVESVERARRLQAQTEQGDVQPAQPAQPTQPTQPAQLIDRASQPE
ncbi:hypothetical protein E4U41_001283 [Claviceps citrina]|nr:hypothetical protein E4U41_001283 [Claviceps citrina]